MRSSRIFLATLPVQGQFELHKTLSLKKWDWEDDSLVKRTQVRIPEPISACNRIWGTCNYVHFLSLSLTHRVINIIKTII